MGRANKKVTDNGSSSSGYSVVRMPGFKMDLHKQQQSLIFSDLNAARQKLEEENMLLRDELAEAKMIIRLLKMKLEERDARPIKKPTSGPVNSKDSTTKGGIPAKAMEAMDRSKKKRYLFKQKTPTRREAFLNPRPPGARAFAARRRSLSPPGLGQQISPRSTFSPILGDKREVSASSFSESHIEDMATKLGRTTISTR